jgi:hypothetical protein
MEGAMRLFRLLLILVFTAAAAPAAAGSIDVQGAAASCHGQEATIVGSPSADILIGTRGRDVFATGGGADVVLGRQGDDLICLGPGADTVDGQQGLDTVYGGTGNDACYASKDREHLLHHGCEAHLRPRRPGAGEPRASVAISATSSERATPQGFFEEAHNLHADCYGNEVHLSVDVSSAYTNPGRVAFLPYFYYRDEQSGNWVGPFSHEWWYFDIPADQIATFPVGRYDTSSHSTWFVGGLFWWSDGTQWVTRGYDWKTTYTAFDQYGIQFCLGGPA